MRPLNQSHQRAASNKFSRMQASLSKVYVTTVSSSLTLLHFNQPRMMRSRIDTAPWTRREFRSLIVPRASII